MDRFLLEQQLTQLPLYQYAFFKPEELPFSERVQQVCRLECPMYGKSWSCPPAVGTVAQCRQQCLSYDDALLMVTVQEVLDSSNLTETLKTKPFHTAQVRQVRQLLETQGMDTLCLSGDACDCCRQCAYPEQACRQPDRQMPCLEGYGVVVSDLAQRYGVPFPPENGLVFWYAVILFRPKA